MLQAYVVIGFKNHLHLIEANPYTLTIEKDKIYLNEIDKNDAEGLVYYLLEDLKPAEIYLFRDSITVIGVNGIIKQRKHTLTK